MDHALNMAASWGLDRWKGRVALVTGASSGMGYVIAKQLTESGMKVVGCARNIAKIEASPFDDLALVPCCLLS